MRECVRVGTDIMHAAVAAMAWTTGVDIESREEVGVKFEHIRSRRPQLEHEFDVMALLVGHGLHPSFCRLPHTWTCAYTHTRGRCCA